MRKPNVKGISIYKEPPTSPVHVNEWLRDNWQPFRTKKTEFSSEKLTEGFNLLSGEINEQ